MILRIDLVNAHMWVPACHDQALQTLLLPPRVHGETPGPISTFGSLLQITRYQEPASRTALKERAQEEPTETHVYLHFRPL